ncbi:MAG: bifunctional glutamate N-acetyltransferase/amino-acid acetyltransferase ArgJ [Chloroflexi bacterium]|nr:bifunctional glutamate N-acetyltransferase/amino-acid acetyltransferase ArgJ [Chloroflexota bacterium]
MSQHIKLLEKGTITSAKGFQAGATFAGMKSFAEDKYDLGIVYSTRPCTCAGTFSTNEVRSFSIRITEDNVRKGEVRAVIANSGIANAVVGDQGRKDALEMARLAAQQLGVQPDQVGVLSTGLIGAELPMALIRSALPKVKVSEAGGTQFARCMMTTDTAPKEVAVAYQHGGRTVTIGGVAKGSGMIHPNMATMLCVVATDAAVEAGFLRQALKSSVDRSFNMISVDGDTSTNDTVLLLANGAAGGQPVAAGSPEAALFQEALDMVCTFLAKAIVRDGEGASKIFEVRIEGARNEAEARMAARTITNSNLVRTAVHGNDPNWGRVIAALGRSGAKVEESKLSLYINGVCIMEGGLPIPFFKDAVIMQMRQPEVSFRVSLGLGDGSATAWGCNLSEAYVTFNSAYTT